MTVIPDQACFEHRRKLKFPTKSPASYASPQPYGWREISILVRWNTGKGAIFVKITDKVIAKFRRWGTGHDPILSLNCEYKLSCDYQAGLNSRQLSIFSQFGGARPSFYSVTLPNCLTNLVNIKKVFADGFGRHVSGKYVRRCFTSFLRSSVTVSGNSCSWLRIHKFKNPTWVRIITTVSHWFVTLADLSRDL